MDFLTLANKRHSVRNYTSQVPSKEVLTQVMEAARIAPSAVNFQPWQFIVVTEQEQLSKVHACYHREWIDAAPACIVVLGDHKEAWHRNADNKDFCDVDVAIAIDHLTLQATALGLGTCWVCNFEVEKVQSLFDLPSHLEPIALLPIGYPEQGVEAKEKVRKPLNDIVKWIC